MLRKIILGSLVCVCANFAYAAKIRVHITNPLKNVPTVYLPEGNEFPIKVNAQGQGEISFKLQQPGYVKVGYNYVTRLFWLDDASTLDLAFEGKEFYKSVELKGKFLTVNNYLNKTEFQFSRINDTELGESDFLHKTDSLFQVNLNRLNGLQLPESFKRAEAKRLKYLSYQTLPLYPQFHKRIAKDANFKASPVFWNKLKEVAVFQEELLASEDYQSFIMEAVKELVRKEFPNLKLIDRLTAYVDRHVRDARVAEFLVYKQVYMHVERKGLDDASYTAAFKKYVKDAGMIQRFDQLCGQFDAMGKGAPLADFNATDIHGKKVSVKDLRGKFVYIDIWATWCVPCRKELPFLAKLEEKYKNADIHFVSISCDTNRKAWERMVTNQKMKGIQLHFSDDSFLKKYLIQGVPHFIMLDKEGRIISLDMTRPSDPSTAALFEKLLK